jgi:hypothetical protein
MDSEDLNLFGNSISNMEQPELAKYPPSRIHVHVTEIRLGFETGPNHRSRWFETGWVRGTGPKNAPPADDTVDCTVGTAG